MTDRPRIWLSIDWDYFCRQPKAQWFQGRDETVSQKTTAWAVRAAFNMSRGVYLKEEMSLQHARPRPMAFWRALKGLGYRFDALRDIVVADSHKGAYRAFRGRQTANVRLVSFDAHHDLFYASRCMIEHLHNGTPDCSNWHMLTLMRYHRLRSLLVYPHWKGLAEWQRMMRNIRKAGGDALGVKKWVESRVQAVVWPDPRIKEVAGQVERVFICRSSAWTPPWHDKAFYRFVYHSEEAVDMLADARGIPPIRPFNWGEIMKIAVLETKLLKLV